MAPNGSAEGATLPPPTLKLELKRDPHAPSIARSAVLERCREFDLGSPLSQTLVLLVSEVVSNAVLHSPGRAELPIVLSATVTEQAVRVSVVDAGKGFTPKPREPRTTQGGYGLYLLERVASAWGVDRIGGTRVWFELERSE